MTQGEWNKSIFGLWVALALTTISFILTIAACLLFASQAFQAFVIVLGADFACSAAAMRCWFRLGEHKVQSIHNTNADEQREKAVDAPKD